MLTEPKPAGYATYEEARRAADLEEADFIARTIAHGHLLAKRFTEAYADILPPGCRLVFNDAAERLRPNTKATTDTARDVD